MRYPEWTGDEPCRQVDPELYFYSSLNKMRPVIQNMVAQMCASCPSHDPCLMWALHHEEYGYWAGTTSQDRAAMRKAMRIPLTVLPPGVDDRRKAA